MMQAARAVPTELYEVYRLSALALSIASPSMIAIEGPDGWTLRLPCEEQALRLVPRLLGERRC
jgi:hypothetical protein